MGAIQVTLAADDARYLDRDDVAAIEQLRAERPSSGPERAANFARVRAIRAEAERRAIVSSGHDGRPSAVAVSVDHGSFIRWPWKALDELTGGMAPGGRPIYLVGFSNIGKSTLIRSAILGWAAQGIAVDVLPLETTAERFAMGLASTLAGVDPGLIASGDYLRQADGEAQRAKLDAAMTRCRHHLLYHPDHVSTAQNPVRLHALPRLNVAGLRRACGEAVDRGAKVCVIDHIDHVQSESRSSFDVSRDVNNAATDIAREMGLLMVLMSQANNDALKGNTDHLARYLPLRESSVWMGQLKMQNANTMLGIYRPIRPPNRDETTEQYANALKAARKGDEPAGNVLLPKALGLSLMKSENYGARVGQRTLLGWRNGEIVEYEQLPYSLR